MLQAAKSRLYRLLRSLERYTKTDMVYLASGGFWIQVGRISAVAIGVTITYVFANFLPKETFGTYKYVIAFAGIISGLSLYAMGTAIVRAVARGHEGILRLAVWPCFKWSLLGFIVAGVAGSYYFFMGNWVLGSALIFVGIAHVIGSTFGNAKSFFLGKTAYKESALIMLPRSAAVALALIITVFVFPHPLALIAVYFLGNSIANLFIHYIVVKRYTIPATDSNPAATSEAVSYATRMVPHGIFVQIMTQIDQFLMWHLAGPAALAAYGLALTPTNELRTLTSGTIGTLAMPKFAQQTKEDLRVHHRRRMLQLFGISVLLALAYIVAAPLLFAFLFPAYPEAIPITQVLALTLLFSPSVILGTQFAAHAHTRALYTVSITNGLSKVILLAVFIPLFGTIGAAWALVASEAIGMATTLLVARYYKVI